MHIKCILARGKSGAAHPGNLINSNTGYLFFKAMEGGAVGFIPTVYSPPCRRHEGQYPFIQRLPLNQFDSELYGNTCVEGLIPHAGFEQQKLDDTHVSMVA